MTKIEKQPQNKVRMNISISREVYEWITKIRGNASRIAEQAYLAIKNDMGQAYGHDSLIIKLKNPQNEPRLPIGVPSAGIEPATYRSSVCRSLNKQNTEPDWENTHLNKSEFLNTSGVEEVRYPLMLNGREIAGPPGMSFAEAFKEKGKQSFMKFHEGKTLSSFKGYANRLEEMDWLYIPEDM